jgi:hypothetical protein
MARGLLIDNGSTIFCELLRFHQLSSTWKWESGNEELYDSIIESDARQDYVKEKGEKGLFRQTVATNEVVATFNMNQSWGKHRTSKPSLILFLPISTEVDFPNRFMRALFFYATKGIQCADTGVSSNLSEGRVMENREQRKKNRLFLYQIMHRRGKGEMALKGLSQNSLAHSRLAHGASLSLDFLRDQFRPSHIVIQISFFSSWK